MKMKSLLAFTLSIAVSSATFAAEITPPPDAEGAAEALKNSPRHGEFKEIDVEGSDVKLKIFETYPERSDKAPVVILIHEIFGMTDWTNSVADALSKEGFIVVAPDLITGIEGAAENPREAIGKLTPEETLKRLNATMKYALTIPSGTGKIGCVGYCYGGRTTFLYATEQPELDAAVVYYGNAPETSTLAKITCPVQGHFGGEDARVNSSLPPAEEEMKKLGKSFEVNIYEGAGHGFLRQQSGQDGANLKASKEAWAKTVAFFKEHLEAK
jgi:carboxymethylenebutenolidase